MAQATERLRQVPVSNELIQRCRANALSLDTPTSPRVDPQAGWVNRWALPIAIAASLVIVMNLGQAIARLPPSDRQLAAIELLPDGRMLQWYSDGVGEQILNTNIEIYQTGYQR